jgi:ankyrin repeat protein
MNFLEILSPMKIEVLYIKNSDGENPLFLAARLGHLDIFNWFTGKIDFFKA